MTKKKFMLCMALTLIIVFPQMTYALPGQMWVGSGSSGAWKSSFEKSFTGIEVELKIKPEVININSKGKYSTLISFPDDASLNDAAGKKAVLHFNTQELNLKDVVSGEEATIYIEGTLKDGTPFWGIDEVRVINN